MDYDNYINQLAIDIIGNNDGRGLLIRILHEDFEMEEYYSIRDRFKALNDAIQRGELTIDQIVDAVGLSYIFYIEMLKCYCPDAPEELYDIAFDAENTFGKAATVYKA